MADVLFKTYAAGLPAASTPPARADGLLIEQGGAVALLQVKDLLGAIPHLVDASGGTVNFDLATYSDVTIIKSDATANLVSILDTTGNTVMRDTQQYLYTQDNSIHLTLIGTNWFRVS